MIHYQWRDEISTSLGRVKRPYAEIRMMDQKSNWHAITMLIDSGADITIVARSIGELYGHNVEKGKEIDLKGIGKAGVKAYIHKMTLLIGDHEVEVDVAVAQDDSVAQNILGRKDVFDFFEIHFKKESTHFIR